MKGKNESIHFGISAAQSEGYPFSVPGQVHVQTFPPRRSKMSLRASCDDNKWHHMMMHSGDMWVFNWMATFTSVLKGYKKEEWHEREGSSPCFKV